MTAIPTKIKRRLVTVRDLIISIVYEKKNVCLFHNVPIYKMNVLQKTSRLKDKKGIDWCINYFNEYSFREMRSSARSFTCSLLQISQILVKKGFRHFVFQPCRPCTIFMF